MAERDANRLHSIVPRCVKNQPAPTAADIEQALSRRESQLAADVIELLLLRHIEAVILRPEIRAGIYHRLIQPKFVEVIRKVVVKADGVAITRLRVQLSV